MLGCSVRTMSKSAELSLSEEFDALEIPEDDFDVDDVDDPRSLAALVQSSASVQREVASIEKAIVERAPAQVLQRSALVTLCRSLVALHSLDASIVKQLSQNNV